MFKCDFTQICYFLPSLLMENLINKYNYNTNWYNVNYLNTSIINAKKISDELQFLLKELLENDENSRMCPGKKDYIKIGGVVHQKKCNKCIT